MALKNFVLVLSSLMIIFSELSLAQSPQTIAGITIKFVNDGTKTTFTLTSPLDGTLTDRWMAVGFNSVNKMVE